MKTARSAIARDHHTSGSRPAHLPWVCLLSLTLTSFATAAEGAAAQAHTRIEGLYLGTVTSYTLAGTNLRTVYYLFFADGRVFKGLPTGGALQSFDVACAQAEEPWRCGEYRVMGGQVSFAWGDGDRDTKSFRVAPEGVEIDGITFFRVRRFDGLRLDGTYSRSAGHRFSEHDPSSGGVVSENSIGFRADGRFSNHGALAVHAENMVDFAPEARGAGTYRIHGNTLELLYADGRRVRFTFFVHPENVGERRPRLIVIDGGNLLLEEGPNDQIAEPTRRSDPGPPVRDSSPPAAWEDRPPTTDPAAAYAAGRAAAEGKALAEAGRWPEAERRFREAIRLEPTKAEYHTRLAVVLAAQDRDDESLAESREALRLGPRESFMHYFAAEALVKLERLPEAEAELRHAIELTPAMWQYHGALGYVLLKQRRFDESLDASTAALRFGPRQAWILDNAGEALMELGRFSESEARFREAIRLAPEAAVVHYDLARLLVRQSRLPEAAREATRAAQLEPANAEYTKLLREIGQQQGRRP